MLYTQRAPSTTSLLCSSCNRRVTPCLVCAHIFPAYSSPASSSSSWKECHNCKLKNPLQDQQRKILDVPPASALPSVMVRRVLIAYIGRPESTMATYLQHRKIKQVLAEAHSDIPCGNREQVNHKESVKHDDGHLPNLPFLLCDGVVTRMAYPLEKKHIHGKEGHHNLIPRSEEGSSIVCSTCGGSSDSLHCIAEDNDAALLRCQEQLVALHCTEALACDMDRCAYPICNTIRSLSPSIISQGKMSCLGRFSNNMLHMLNLPFARDFDDWLTRKGKDKFKFGEMLANVESFLLKQHELLELKILVLKAITAQKQARIDGKALTPWQPPSLRVLEQMFVDRVEERKEKFSSIAKQFSALLSQINLFLEFFYSWACDASTHDPLFVANVEPSSTSMEKRNVVEDVRVAVKTLFLLYHEVAHATDVI